MFFFGNVNAQETSSTHSRFSFIPYGGIGYATAENDNEVNYNLNVNQLTILLYYAFSDAHKWEITTGIGFSELSGNGLKANGYFLRSEAN